MTFNLFQMVSNDLENSRLHVLSLLLNPQCFSQEEEVKRVRGYFQTALETHCDPDDESQASQARASFLDLQIPGMDIPNLCEMKALESKTKLQYFKLLFRALKKNEKYVQFVKIGANTATLQRRNSHVEDEELLPVQGLRSWLCALVGSTEQMDSFHLPLQRWLEVPSAAWRRGSHWAI